MRKVKFLVSSVFLVGAALLAPLQGCTDEIYDHNADGDADHTYVTLTLQTGVQQPTGAAGRNIAIADE
ncbi:MAG: hypothetical protein LBL97_05025, partial [Prevotellaceae bacterium]|nr:hypothetical protein [Prevotellaceae bacterium]